jgi:hypothetical protein
MLTADYLSRNNIGNHASLGMLNAVPANSTAIKEESENGIVKKDSSDRSSSSSSVSPTRDTEISTTAASTSKKRARESADGAGSKKSASVKVDAQDKPSAATLPEIASSQDSATGDAIEVEEVEPKTKKPANKRAKK